MAETLEVTRGDTLPLSFTINYSNGDEYVLEENDSVVFTVKASTKIDDSDVLIQKIMTLDTGLHCECKPEETQLPYGTYKYDVELNRANGQRFTIIKPSNFKITAEVTTHD